MIPKRKLIRKHHRIHKQQQTQLLQNQDHQYIVDKLKSLDSNVKQQAIALLANLTSFPPHLLEPQIIITLINSLYQSDLSLTHSTLFALNNICLIRQKTIPELFQFGFDKALIQLNTNSKELFGPIILLMTTLCHHIPQQYMHFIIGLQNTVANQKHLQDENYQLVLEFLSESKYVATEEKTIQAIVNILENDNKYKNRSLSMRILLMSKHGQSEELLKKLIEYLDEILSMNLQKQYNLNIASKKKQQETGQIEEMEEQVPKTSENDKLTSNTAFDIFIDIVQALQLILEALVQINEEWEEEDDDEEDEDQQQIKSKTIINVQCQLSNILDKLLIQNIKYLERNICTTYIDGCLITQLSLRLLLKVRTQGNKQVEHSMCMSSINCIINTTKMANFPQITSTNINLSLQILLKYKLIDDRTILIALLQYLKLDDIWKECWLSLLQLISLYFNPEKIVVTREENLKIGIVLKKIIIELPYNELEEWRGQAIDTLFDVYSNENFDDNFMQLGFMGVLEHILNEGNNSNKGKGKKNKRNSFISEVLADIHRFLLYKKKMIKL